MEADVRQNRFVCPECGGTESAIHLRVIPLRLDTSPWRWVHGREVCASCRRIVPTPLAERWQGETMDEARDAWQRWFREHPQSGPLSAEVWRRLIVKPGQSAELDAPPNTELTGLR
jgi:hypothetical protein